MAVRYIMRLLGGKNEEKRLDDAKKKVQMRRCLGGEALTSKPNGWWF